MTLRSRFTFKEAQGNPVRLVLYVPGRAPLRGEPLRIHDQGVRGRFIREQDLGLGLGRKASLRFTSRLWKAPIEMDVALEFRSDTDSRRELGFTFVRRSHAQEALFPQLRALFNRRDATRIAPDPKQEVSVNISALGSGVSLKGSLLDLSGAGLLMRVGLDEDAVLADCYECQVTFQLPDATPARLSLLAQIRKRRLYSDHAELALHFDTRDAASFSAQREVILAYVLSRQPRSAHRLKAV